MPPAPPDAGPVFPPPTYPGGESNPAYRLAFTVWAVLFLVVISLGLLNFLGMYVKTRL